MLAEYMQYALAELLVPITITHKTVLRSHACGRQRYLGLLLC